MTKRKYNLDEIKDNLNKFEKKLIDKNLDDGFCVIASRKDFKPLFKEIVRKGITKKEIILKIIDIEKYLLKGKEQYFVTKKIASIRFWFDSTYYNTDKEYDENNYHKIKDEILCSLIIHIFKINENGKIDNKDENDWICKINFTIDDLSKIKLNLKIGEKLMREIAERLAVSTNMFGFYYKDYQNLVKKNKAKKK
jgi:hypothetical protein